ncbi:hypothetical protein [Prevotella sp.]|nr:hypothetical protein [uncultured Prevotella sp.]
MMVIERKIYQKPQCNIVCTETEALLVHASGNAGTIQPGVVTGDAKRNFFNDEEEDQGGTSWNSTENY